MSDFKVLVLVLGNGFAMVALYVLAGLSVHS